MNCKRLNNSLVKKKLSLICSSGGHFLQLFSLKDFWGECDRFWVTFKKPDTEEMLRSEKIYFAFSPTNRNIKNFWKNLILAFHVLKKERPDIVVSTGAGVGVPFIYASKLLGIKTIYIESMTRMKVLSLSGRLVYPVADKFFVQWPELVQKYPKSEYQGQII